MPPASSRSSAPEAASRRPQRERRGSGLLPALVGGLPLAAGILYLILYTPLKTTPLAQYVKHGVEWVELTMFCCALSALAAKAWRSLLERRVFGGELLPPWDGKPVPVEEARPLLARIDRLPLSWQSTALVRRVAAVLDFLCRRGSAAELDDQLRALSDTDALALENSYGLIRFITWAIPILGFLGTVIGITTAIGGVTPEALEKELNKVTDGLGEAFGATALGLALTMVTMLLSYVVDRLEQGILEGVEGYVDRQLAHRFQRPGLDDGGFVEVVRQHTQEVLAATEALVQRQAEVWAKTLAELSQRRGEQEKRQEDRFAGSLEAALMRTLQAHAGQVATLQKQAVQGSTQLLEQLTALATAVRETGREQQAALVRVAESVAGQAKVLGELQAGEKQLLHLEEALNQNLKVVAGTQSFEQVLHNLTAAVHLLMARAQGEVRPFRLDSRQGSGTAA